MSLTAPGPSASVVARAESSPLPCATVGSRRADDFPSSQRSRVRSARLRCSAWSRAASATTRWRSGAGVCGGAGTGSAGSVRHPW